MAIGVTSNPSRQESPADATPVPLLDLDRENGPLQDAIATAMAAVVSSGRFVLGPQVAELEEALAARTSSTHAIGCASGSDALLLCMMAMGIGPGDEVLLPSFTFFATASAVRRLGAVPVFVDIEQDSLNIDPVDVERKITPNTRGIIPVHLFGRSANMTRLMEIAEQHQLVVIEDCAQSIDATHAGRPSGSIGLAGCFSFYPTKNLGGFGDGGMITTSDSDFAEQLRILRGHGMQPRYHHGVLGINSRLDSLQAAVLLTKLPFLSEWTQQRKQNAALYRELFSNDFAEHGISELLGESVELPQEDANDGCVWNQFTVRVKGGQRDELRQALAAQKIGSEVYYPLPLHQQPCFADLGWETGSLPVTEQAAREVLSLPVFPYLSAAEQQTTVRAIGSFYERALGKRAA